MNAVNIVAAPGFSRLAEKVEKDFAQNFGSTLETMPRIAIGKSTDAGHRISRTMMQSGVYLDYGKKNGNTFAPGAAMIDALRVEQPKEAQAYINRTMDSLLQAGLKEDEALDRIAGTVKQMMGFDPATGQYVRTAGIANVTDSMISSSQFPFWDIGYYTRIFRQPLVSNYAKSMVSLESPGNPWCDAIAVYRRVFEGFGKISQVAQGLVEATASSPVSSNTNLIMQAVINLAIDYESSIEANLRAGQPGNFLSASEFSDNERYADLMLERLHNVLIYFGNDETGTEGLQDIAGETVYGGTPLNTIVNGASTTKGALIVEEFNGIVQEFLRENRYMPTEIRINCSTYVMKAMMGTSYSQGFMPDSPIKILQGTFNAKNDLGGGGLQTCKWTLVADPLLDPNTPYNTASSDLMFITVPAIKSAWGEDTGLVIAPEVLKRFIVPAFAQRSGTLFTMYKRVAGVIAPIGNTVKCIRGFGYSA